MKVATIYVMAHYFMVMYFIDGQHSDKTFATRKEAMDYLDALEVPRECIYYGSEPVFNRSDVFKDEFWK